MANHYFLEKRMQEIWKNFISHFKNIGTAASYQSDLMEIMEYLEKGFLEITNEDVKEYFNYQMSKVDQRILQPSTLAKKIRELNSFSSYIVENREYLKVDASYENHFSPYLKKVNKISKFANSIPTEQIDQLLNAAQDDIMAYSIMSLLYRMGLSSTEIIELKTENFAAYDNGVYLKVKDREDACFVPEDVYKIVLEFLEQTGGQDQEFLFLNSRGNQLNTMYISRLMKKYTTLAGIPSYSAEALRNSCVYTMFSYHAKPEQIAKEMGVTDSQIRRYNNKNYIDSTSREVRSLVKIKIELPE